MSVVHCLVQPDDLMSKATAICGLVLRFGANLSEIYITSVRRRPHNLPLRLNRCVSTLMSTKFTSEPFRIDSSQGWLSLMCPDVVCSCDECHHSACNLTRRFDSPGSRCVPSNEEILLLLFLQCPWRLTIHLQHWDWMVFSSYTTTCYYYYGSPPPAGLSEMWPFGDWEESGVLSELIWKLSNRSEILSSAPADWRSPAPNFLLFFLSLSLF